MAVERADDTPEDRNWLGQLADVVKGRTDDAVIGPISSPYTD